MADKAAEAPIPAVAAAPVATDAPVAAAAAPQPSLLAAADAGKAAHAAEVKPDAPLAADAKPEIKADPKADSKTDSKAGTEPAAKPDAKPEAAAAADAKADDGKAKPEAGKVEKPAEAKPEVKPDPSAEKPADKVAEALAEQPPVPPKFDAFKLPENFKADNTRLSAFTDLLGKTELAGKVDHKVMQDFGQELVDFHSKEMQRVAQEVMQHQVDVWNRMKEGWINELKTDPNLGGNRIETSLGNAKYAFENFLGLDKVQQGALLTVMDNAGLSDHPIMVRALHNLYERLAEPTPAAANLPGNANAKGKGPGERGWYSTVEGVKLA